MEMIGSGKNQQYLLGIDLNREYAQLSFVSPGRPPQSVSTVAGSELYQIPLALYRPKADSWLFGREALELAREDGKIPFTDLLQAVYARTKVTVSGEETDAIELLALFLRRSFSILPNNFPLQKVSAVVLCAEGADGEGKKQLRELGERLKLASPAFFVIDRKEAAFSYIVRQKPELWSRDVLFAAAAKGALELYHFSVNKEIRPNTANVDLALFGQPEGEVALKLSEGMLSGADYATVYLIGDTPERKWDEDNLRQVLRGKRVFQGNNLFCLGAAFYALSRTGGERGIIYLGEDKIRSDLSLEVFEGEKRRLLSLIDVGTSFFGLNMKLELYLNEARGLTFHAACVDRPGAGFSKTVYFPELPERAGFATRIRLSLSALSAREIAIQVTDLGMGMLYPAAQAVSENILVLPDVNAELEAEKDVPRPPSGEGAPDPAARMTIGNYAETPYEEKRTRTRVYCIEELAMLISRSASLLDESLLDEELVKWVQVELGLPELAKSLRSILSGRGQLWELAEKLMEAAYCPARDRRNALTVLRKTSGKDPLEKRKDQAIRLAQMGKYGKALGEFIAMLKEIPSDQLRIRSEILHDMGVLEAQSFRFQAAADFFYQAYNLDRDQESFEAYVMAKRLGSSQTEYVGLAAEVFSDHIVQKTEQRITQAKESWVNSPQRGKLDRLSELKFGGDSLLYYQECGRLIRELQEEYRSSME